MSSLRGVVALLLVVVAITAVSGLGFFGTDSPGNDLATTSASSDLNCAIACDNNPSCKAWSWDNTGSGNCWLKSGASSRNAVNNRVFGIKPTGQGVDRIGGDMPGMPLNLGSATASSCAAQCQSTAGCVAWSFDSCGKSSCWLKNSMPTSTSPNSCRISAIQGTYNIDYPGADLSSVQLPTTATASECHTQCLNTNGCNSWAMVQPGVGCELVNTCWLKSSGSQAAYSTNNCRVSGVIGGGGGGGGGSGKCGLAWSYTEWPVSNALLFVGSGKKCTWYYTWSAWTVQVNQKSSAEFVPMFHNTGSASEFTQALNAGEFSKSKYALFLNEPDLAGVQPSQAVTLWKQYMEPLRSKGITSLGAPAVISDQNDPNKGLAWLRNFFNLCTGCNINFLPLHWYGIKAQDFMNYVTTAHNAYPNLPIWVTEFACLSTNQNDVNNFMRDTTTWLDQQSWVARYSWFGAMRNTGTYVPQVNGLLSSDGLALTTLGTQYAVSGGH